MQQVPNNPMIACALYKMPCGKICKLLGVRSLANGELRLIVKISDETTEMPVSGFDDWMML